jgi:hypothetical protein
MTDLGGDLEAYRTGLREFLVSADLDPWRNGYREDVADAIEFTAGMVGLLYDEGWGRYGYPSEVGGLGGDVRHVAVLYDEIAAADLPVAGQHELLTTLAYPMIRYAPELSATYFPGFLRGEEIWGQGFSEPEAGSDLAALRCRARLDGDNYVVSGQKIWTSYGIAAKRLVVLVRTGTPESRHRGLSMVFLDADAPGVTVRPIYLASGRAELAECFFDGVVVGAERMIGTEGQGWEIAMYLLQFERAVYGWQRAAMLLRRLRDLIAAATDTPSTRERLGTVYLDVLSLRARSVATVRRLAAGHTVGPEASADKLLLSAAEHSVYDAARSILGPSFAIGNGEELARWRENWWYSRTTTIYGGSAEVQRGILADHILKLPKAAR